MEISRTDPSIVADLLRAFSNKKTRNTARSNAIIKVPEMQALSQERMITTNKSSTVNTGYDQNGNELVYSTLTNQKVSQSDIQEQNYDRFTPKYTGSLTASQLLEKFANGDELSDEEYNYMAFKTNSTVFDDAFHKRNNILDERNISKVLTKNNIQLAPDQELRISIDCQNKITVSGIDDPAKCQQIANDLSSEANNLASSFQINSETYKKVSMNFAGAAQALGVTEQYLNKKTNGKISITDLTLQDGKIVGLTPELDQLLNRDITPEDCLKSWDELETDRMKGLIQYALAYIQVNGTENLPQINYTLSYKNGKLSCIEQPDLVKQHPQLISREEYDKQALLFQNDPIGYFKSVAANKGQ